MTERERAGAAVAPFERLLEPILGIAFAAALHMTRNRSDAEDLVQDTALLAFKNFHTFQPGTNFRAWFLRIETNCFLSQLRRHRPERDSVDLEDVPELYLQDRALGLGASTTDPSELVLSKLDSEQVSASIARLPDEYRVVAALYFVEDLSYQQIADMVGRPVGTVRSRIHRGRRLLQKALWETAIEHGIVPRPESGKE